MIISISLPSPPPAIVFLWTSNYWHILLAESEGPPPQKKKIWKTTHSSKADKEKMHLLNTELCCWKSASGFSVLDSPGSLRQRVGKTTVPQSGTAFWVRYRDSPVQWCPVASQALSSGGNPYSIRWLLGQGTVVYGRRQWVTGSGVPWH